MQGDLVALRLNPVSEWIQCSDGPGQCNSNAAEGEEEDMLMLKDAAMAASEAGSRLMWPLFLSEGDDGSFWSETSPADALLDVNGRLALDRNLQPVGRVVQILKSSFRGNLYAGSLLKKYSRERKNRRQSGNLTAFKPLNSRVPHMLIPGHLLSKSVGGGSGKRRPIIMGRRDMNWPVHSKMPWLEDLVYVGHAGDLKAETSALLKEAGIDYNGFSREVEREATDLCKDADSVTRSEIAEKRRVDMRHKRVFTIDPPNARDLDDAVHIELISEDVVEIGVHIADVSSYVLPGSKIDAEAQRRCTTVYLVNETIPMLPRSLCEHQCSLCPGQDRRAFSCIFRMNRDGTLIDHPPWYGKTLIRSCCQLDYLTAQHLIDGMIDEESGADSPDPDHWDEQRWPVGQRWQEVMADTKLMHEVAMCRREKRCVQSTHSSICMPLALNPRTSHPCLSRAFRLHLPYSGLSWVVRFSLTK
jgi:DIS3-like exonuclease 2